MRIYYNYYYTLKEVLANANTLSTAMTNYFGTLPGWYTNADSPYLEELYTRLNNAFNRKGIYFAISNNDYDLTNPDEYDELVNDSASRIEDLFETFRETKDKYIEVIKNQASLKSTILNELENVSEHYFNDTPETNGSYINENYTSTYSKDITKLDIGPVSQKLAETELAMDDKYDLWLRHFRKFKLIGE